MTNFHLAHLLSSRGYSTRSGATPVIQSVAKDLVLLAWGIHFHEHSLIRLDTMQT
jgi:hypothetical protein